MEKRLGFVGSAGGIAPARTYTSGRCAVSRPVLRGWRLLQSARVVMHMQDAEGDAPEASAESAEAEAPVTEAAAPAADAPAAADETPEPSDTGRRQPGRGGRRPKRDAKYQLSDLSVNMEVEGTVRSTTKYGAFIDIGCTTDGLVHVSQLSSDYVEKVEDVVKAGDTVNVRIISVNPEKNEFSLTMKPPGESKSGGSGGQGGGRSQEDRISWKSFVHDPKKFVPGKVVSVTDYGAFIDIEGPTDGMVHISEMSGSRVESVDSILSVGDEIEVRVVEVDERRRRISLSMVEWKEPGEEERRKSADSQAIEQANQQSVASLEFKSAFELAIEKANAKTKATA